MRSADADLLIISRGGAREMINIQTNVRRRCA
jgi:hypothetical protein